MKTNTYIYLLTVALLVGGVVPASAQFGKNLGKAVEAVSKQASHKGISPRMEVGAPLGKTPPVVTKGAQYSGTPDHWIPNKIPGTKRYIYPPKKVEQLKNSLNNPVIRAAIAALKPYEILAGHTPQREFLSLIETENSFYKEEISLAKEVMSELKHRASSQTPLNNQELIKVIEKLSFIQNDHLRLQLYRNLLSNDLTAMVRDLSDYFTLDKPFEEAALSYMIRNPHKRTLRTVRLLHNPFIADSFKTPIKRALGKTSLTVQEQESLKEALKALNEEYRRILTQVKQEHKELVDKALLSDVMQNKLREYEKTFDELETFVAVNGHLPQWQSRSSAERALNIQATRLAAAEHVWPFEPFLSKRAEMETLLKKYEPKRRSLQETIEAFERFVQKTGRQYPRMIDEGLDVGKEEYQLFDDLFYWRIQNSNTIKRIEEIQKRHASPVEDGFYY